MKQRYAIFLIILSFGAMILISCQENKEQEAPPHLFAEFFVRYLQEEKELKAHASFFEGDSISTAVPKSFADGATFQGESMEARSLPGGTLRYTFEQAGTYADTFYFRFKDDQGQAREIPVAMVPVENFSIREGKASKSGGMTLMTKGGKLEKGESLVLLFNDEDNKASTIMLTGPSAGEEYRIPAAKVETLSTGKNTLYLVKKKRVAEKGNSLSSFADIEFYTNTIEVEVVD